MLNKSQLVTVGLIQAKAHKEPSENLSSTLTKAEQAAKDGDRTHDVSSGIDRDLIGCARGLRGADHKRQLTISKMVLTRIDLPQPREGLRE